MILETAITTVSREVRMDGCIETSQIVCTCDKNILYAPIPQTIQYGRPEPCALILADPHPQNIFAAVQIKADLRFALRCGHGSGSHPEKLRHRSIPQAAAAILSPQAGSYP